MLVNHAYSAVGCAWGVWGGACTAVACAHAFAHGKAARPGDSSGCLCARTHSAVGWHAAPARRHTHARAHTRVHAPASSPPCLSFPRPGMACKREGRITTAMQGGRFKVYDACAGHPDHRPVSSVSTSPSPPRAHTRWTHISHTRRTYIHTCLRLCVHTRTHAHPGAHTHTQIVRYRSRQPSRSQRRMRRRTSARPAARSGASTGARAHI